MASKFWLFKTEPGTYAFADLIKDKKTAWSGVRNFQARNFLKQINRGDQVLIYHSGKDKSVVGVAKVLAEGYIELDKQNPGDWVQIDIGQAVSLNREVPLSEIKKEKILSQLLLIKQSRLSVMPVTEKEFKKILEMGEGYAERR